jgi:thiol-disulfide isomerase/thioredoxin
VNRKNLLLLIFFFCQILDSSAQKGLVARVGTWQGELLLNGTTRLPFYFEVNRSKGKTTLEIRNGEEHILIEDITESSDSIRFRMPQFDSEFLCEVKENGKALDGVWINHSRKDNNEIPFQAFYGREYTCDKGSKIFSALQAAQWEVTFSPNTRDSTKAIGIFRFDFKTHSLNGTFLTETGDYRYLSGFACTDWAYLSCFDGSHAYYFRFKLKPDNTIAGDYYSGSTGYEKWIAKQNPGFRLHNPDSLTFLKKGYDGIDFRFSNTEGAEVSSKDEKFRNKVVVIQIMGSWCPNCMDETKYYADVYSRFRGKGLEVVALAFEKPVDPAKAKENVLRVKKRFNADYDFLLTGKTGSTGALEALPMLNAVMAFPTTIYIDKKGRVRKIYTGFNGPGTGVYYDQFREQNERFLEKLLSE